MSGLSDNCGFLLFGAGYWLKRFVLRRRIPFIGGYVLNESCNLSCDHCRVSNRGDAKDPTFDEALGGLDALYGRGARLLAITGGEPFHWRDGEKTLEDVILAARRKGFRRISVYTNGTFPLVSSADTIFVSLDGRRESTRKLRGDVYDQVFRNIDESSHGNIIVNFTINALNRGDVEPFCREVAENRKIKGVFFFFHTPYYGRDELFVDKEMKKSIVEILIRMKRIKLPVLNSMACLKAVASDKWNRPTDFCQVYAEGKIVDCCRSNGNRDACDNCGYLGYVEVERIMKLHPSAIAAGFNYI